jgi:hypothetical protein
MKREVTVSVRPFGRRRDKEVEKSVDSDDRIKRRNGEGYTVEANASLSRAEKRGSGA